VTSSWLSTTQYLSTRFIFLHPIDKLSKPCFKLKIEKKDGGQITAAVNLLVPQNMTHIPCSCAWILLARDRPTFSFFGPFIFVKDEVAQASSDRA
jgi:hypothetical protein